MHKLPPLDEFESQILQWDILDFNQKIEPDLIASQPSEWKKLESSIGKDIRLGKIPTLFNSSDEYIKAFYPIFLLECRESFAKAIEYELESPELMKSGKFWTQQGFIYFTLQRPNSLASSPLSNGDLLLILPDSDCFQDTELSDVSNLDLSKSQFIPTKMDYILSIVDIATNIDVTVKMKIPDVNAEKTDKFNRIKNIISAVSHQGHSWSVKRVMSLATMYREYQGLMSFPQLILKDHLLCSEYNEDNSVSSIKSINKLKYSENKTSPTRLSSLTHLSENISQATLEIPSHLKNLLTQLYNDSQLSALNNCMKTTGITLIQGPPGTGKTTTIIGILSVLLNASTKINPTNLNPALSNQLLSSRDSEKQTSCENLKKLQPWLYDSHNFTNWYDEVDYTMEDLEHPFLFSSINGSFEKHPITIKDQKNILKPQRVLICAPSNAAIDEILKRLTLPTAEGGGIFDASGAYQSPSIVRVGPNIHPELIEHSLEYKANKRMKAKGTTAYREKLAIKNKILKEASIVCATQSMCGSHDIVTFEDGFDTVVIDEASQGVELSTLIPLRLGCRRLILVGDPKQLSATVVSRLAIKLKYDISLFQRLEEAGYSVNVLSIQYRMHPKISIFPSRNFYNSQLKDAENLLEFLTPPLPWSSIPIFQPLVFFSINSSHEKIGTSLINQEEAGLVVQLIELVGMILQETGQSFTTWSQRIAVISPYANQVQLIRKYLKRIFKISEDQPCPIDVNTVDGFQGREKDFIVFSAVRARFQKEDSSKKQNQSVGFLSDIRRMNVAITRGRQNLWIIGNGQFLIGNSDWKNLWEHCVNSKCLINVNLQNGPYHNYLKIWLLSYLDQNMDAFNLFQKYTPIMLKQIEADLMTISTSNNLLPLFDKETLNQTTSTPTQVNFLNLLEQAQTNQDDFEYTEQDNGDIDPAYKNNLEL